MKRSPSSPIRPPPRKPRGFLRQEAQHAQAHRLHLRALIAQHPGLQQVLDDAIASFDRLRDRKPLKFYLAYSAALEATFTYFKLILDNRDTLLDPGDSRLASLFAWHFVEEIEHRSSALIIFNAVVPHPWYRLWVLPQAMAHISTVTGRIFDGFAEYVPREVVGFDTRGLHPRKGPLLGLRNRIVPIRANPSTRGFGTVGPFRGSAVRTGIGPLAGGPGRGR